MTWADIMQAAAFAELINDKDEQFQSVTFEHRANGVRYKVVMDEIELSGFWAKPS